MPRRCLRPFALASGFASLDFDGIGRVTAEHKVHRARAIILKTTDRTKLRGLSRNNRLRELESPTRHPAPRQKRSGVLVDLYL